MKTPTHEEVLAEMREKFDVFDKEMSRLVNECLGGEGGRDMIIQLAYESERGLGSKYSLLHQYYFERFARVIFSDSRAIETIGNNLMKRPVSSYEIYFVWGILWDKQPDIFRAVYRGRPVSRIFHWLLFKIFIGVKI